jgi:acyl-CoA synthetase (AMP-forming)/AMP-acid ligase II
MLSNEMNGGSGDSANVRAVTERGVGTITDEAVARLRARVGVPEPHPGPPHYTVLTTDVFRHVAEAYGDDNPLWWDPDHGPKTRSGGHAAGVAPQTDGLSDYCRAHLAPYKLPVRFEVVDALPRNEVGKVLKRELRGSGA